jgi:hypothetical protein
MFSVNQGESRAPGTPAASERMQSTGHASTHAVSFVPMQIRGRAPISDSDRFTYDVAPDGKRFLVNQYVKPEQPAPLTILLHAGSPPAK